MKKLGLPAPYFPDGTLDYSKLRFVLYARKSTEENDKQFLSIPRQIEMCQDIAKRNGYNIVDVKTEQHSARYSGQRPVFSSIISDIKAGKYDAIIAYHPDRLSRNMLESGIILDMLTPAKNEKIPILKTLAFATLAFTNDSAGRLMLAMLFAMATQYSEHLQEVVVDGMQTTARLGKAQGNHKWGYKIDEKDDYVPDEKWFPIIRRGWDMILNGKSRTEVLEYWTAEDVHTFTKTTAGKDGKKVSPLNPTSVSRIFGSPFYYGIHIWNGIDTDLRNNGKYEPMVSEEEWNRVQFILDSGNIGRKKRRNTYNTERFLPLKGGMVRCHGCGGVMYPSVHGKKNAKHRLVYYRCQNKDCPYKRNEVRGYIIFDQIYKLLDGITPTEDAYEQYKAAIQQYREVELQNLANRKLSLEGQKRYLGHKRQEDIKQVKKLANMEGVAQSVLDDANATVEEDEASIDLLGEEIREIERKLNGTEALELTENEFLNLLKNVKKQIENGNFVQKDAIARLLFSNLEIDDQKRLIPIWNKAFSGLFNGLNFTDGESGGARTLDTLLKRQVL